MVGEGGIKIIKNGFVKTTVGGWPQEGVYPVVAVWRWGRSGIRLAFGDTRLDEGRGLNIQEANFACLTFAKFSGRVLAGSNESR